MNHNGMRMLKYLEKILLSSTLSTANPTWSLDWS